MKAPKLISFLLAGVFLLSLNASGAGAEGWKRACEGGNYKSYQMPFFDFYYPEKCPALADEEADTFKYYDLQQLCIASLFTLANIGKKLHVTVTNSFKIYVVTDPKRFAALKGKDDLSPVGNICFDSKARSMLVCATPANKPKLGYSLRYGVASLILKGHMDAVNPEGELCDALTVGICAHCSCLNDVVEPDRIVTLPYLLEDKLLLPEELFLPPGMKDPERRLYFLRQSRALASNIFLAGEAKFAEYINTVKGGNSGFRNSFQNLYVSDKWAGNYDDFCKNLNFRVFYPLTKEPMTDPLALDKWEKSLAKDDAAPPAEIERKRTDLREKENHIRVHHRIDKVYH